MVSKTFVCLALLAVVAVCNCAPYSGEMLRMKQQNQQSYNMERRNNANSNVNNDSNEYNQEPQELISQKQEKKNLQVLDTSSGNSEEWVGKNAKVMISQEDDNNSKEIHQAPEHQLMHQKRGPDYMRGQQVRENIQKSRQGNDDMSRENNSQGGQNQINRHY